MRRRRRPAAALAGCLALVTLLLTCRGGDGAGEAWPAAPAGPPAADGAAPATGLALASTPGGPAPFAEASAAEAFGHDALLYRIGETPCAVLRAGLDGVAAGMCGEELRPRVYLRPDRPLRLGELIDRYAPFELEVGDEEVELHGRGTQEAGPIERRMVLEWARRLMAEARGVTATRGFRLAFEWHRQIQGGRDCEALAVYLSGEALATTCDGLRASGDVEHQRMAAIFAWRDQVAPFQAVREGGAGGEAVADRLLVPGAGDAAHDDDTVKSMIALARTIHADVLARQLARRQAEEERVAAREAALLAEAERPAERRPAARPWVPPSIEEEEQGRLTLSEAIAVGADPEQVDGVSDRAGGEATGEGGGAEGAGGGGGGADDGGANGGGDNGGGGANGGGGDDGGGDEGDGGGA